MAEEKNAPNGASDLRQRAEEAASAQPALDRELSPDETQRLIHELRVHQIELEMQNDELRRAQLELEASRDRYSDLYDFAPVGYLTIGEKGLIQEANLTVTEMLGVERGRLIGQPFSRFVLAEDEDVLYLHRMQILQTGERQRCEIRMVRNDGTAFDVQLESIAVQDRDRNRWRTSVSDVTERKRMAQQFVRLERLRALGEMSAGVSHNLNNMLTGVMGPAQLLQRMTDDADLLREVDDILASSRRARDLVHRLHLATMGIEEDALEAVDVNPVLESAVEMSQPRWKDESEAVGIPIEVVTNLDEVPSIRGTASRLHDIFVNLLLNALDAMPEGGRIGIRTRHVDGGVQITFSDTGIGMDEETRRRVFEPFFTTKTDVGSGLGLSTVYGTVTRWGGDIRVESAPGKGTTFSIRLPAWGGEAGAGGGGSPAGAPGQASDC